jgi:hypothetical protein
VTEQGYTTEAGESGAISAPLAERIKRGIDLYEEHGESIEWIGTTRAHVPSGKHPTKKYLVIFDNGAREEERKKRCSCPDYHRSGLYCCKHIIAALISWSKQAEYRVQRHVSPLRNADEWIQEWAVIETRMGEDRVVDVFPSQNEAYFEKWEREGFDVKTVMQ